MQHKLSAGRASVGCNDRYLDPKLVRSAGFALADAFDLGSVEGIELPAALTRALGADLAGARQRGCEGVPKIGFILDLARDIANEPPQPCAQEPHFSMMAIELLGVGIAPRHHRRSPGQTQVGLT